MTKDFDILSTGSSGSGEFPGRFVPAALRGMWAAMSEDARLSIHILDGRGRVLALNELAAEMAGVDAASAIGREIGELYPKTLAADVREQLANVVSRGLSCENGSPILSTLLLGGRRWRCSMRLLDMRDGASGVAHETPWPGAGAHYTTFGILRVCRVASDPDHLESLVERVSKAQDRGALLGPLSVLTDRELEVAMLIAAGLTDAAIAKRLFRSLRTVHAHRRAIGSKLRQDFGIRNRSDLIRVMTERGLVARVEN